MPRKRSARRSKRRSSRRRQSRASRSRSYGSLTKTLEKLKTIVKKAQAHDCFDELIALSQVEKQKEKAKTYTPKRGEDLAKVPNQRYIPAFCAYQNNKSSFNVLFASEEPLNDDSVTLLESMAYSSAAVDKLYTLHPYLAPLNIHARCRMADGAFWDRCSIATVVLRQPKVQTILYIGTDDINVLLDYGRSGTIDLDGYTGANKNKLERNEVSDPIMKPYSLFSNMIVVEGDDAQGTIRCTTTDDRVVNIDYQLYPYPETVNMLFEEDKLTEWTTYVSDLMAMPAPNANCDALAIQGGGMIALIVGACAMSKLRSGNRLPQIISGVSGGAWATAVYFSYLHGYDVREHEQNLLRYIMTSLQRSSDGFDCNATSDFLDKVSNVIPMSKLLKKHNFHWKEFVDNLIGVEFKDVTGDNEKYVSWKDMQGYTVYHPCCILNNGGFISSFETALDATDRKDKKSIVAHWLRQM